MVINLSLPYNPRLPTQISMDDASNSTQKPSDKGLLTPGSSGVPLSEVGCDGLSVFKERNP